MATNEGFYYYSKEEIDEQFAEKVLDDFTYSTTEKACGVWIDDSTIYRKTIEISSLPNASTSTYPHGISNIDELIKFEAFARNTSGTLYPLPHINLGNIASGIYINVSKTDITIGTGDVDRSSYTGEVTIYYTKEVAS